MEQRKINLITRDNIHIFEDGSIDISFDIPDISDIVVRLATADDLMSLMIVADKIKREGKVINSIYVPYLSPNNLDVVASVINNINYRTIYINDPNWKVPFIINKCCLENALSHLNYGNPSIAIVYPAAQMQYSVENSYVYEPGMEIKAKTIRIVDSYCFNPNGYCAMARDFKNRGYKVELVISYILAGLDKLLDAFDKIYTTNGYSDIEDNEKIEIYKLR